MGRLPLETSQSEGVFGGVSSENVSSKVPKQIQFNFSGTSKFRGARDVVGESGKQGVLQRTLAYGTKYGIGVFCLFETGEQQMKMAKPLWRSLENVFTFGGTKL